MPLKSWKKNIGSNIKELKKDNMKSGKAKGANWKPRSMSQILAIALSKAKIEPKKEAKRDKGHKENKIERKEYKK